MLIIAEYNYEILWILDGYDEFHDYLKTNPKSNASVIFQSLLKSNNVLITTRPYYSGIEGFEPNTIVSLTGFSDLVIDSNIHNFFQSVKYEDEKKRVKSIQSLSNYLKSHPKLEGLCRIPINLQLTCALFYNELLEGVVTATMLYSRVVAWLLRRYLIKPLDPVKDYFEIRAIRNCDDYHILNEHPKCKIPKKLLSYFAFESLQQKKPMCIIESSVQFIRKYYSYSNSTVDMIQMLNDIGIIRSIDEKPTINSLFYFHHSSFRDFFAAIHFYDNVKTDSDFRIFDENTRQNITWKNWLLVAKQRSENELFCWFLSGICTTQEIEKDNVYSNCDKFLDVIFDFAKGCGEDIYLKKKTFLLARCVQETYFQDNLVASREYQEIALKYLLFYFRNACLSRSLMKDDIIGKIRSVSWIFSNEIFLKLFVKMDNEFKYRFAVSIFARICSRLILSDDIFPLINQMLKSIGVFSSENDQMIITNNIITYSSEAELNLFLNWVLKSFIDDQALFEKWKSQCPISEIGSVNNNGEDFPFKLIISIIEKKDLSKIEYSSQSDILMFSAFLPTVRRYYSINEKGDGDSTLMQITEKMFNKTNFRTRVIILRSAIAFGSRWDEFCLSIFKRAFENPSEKDLFAVLFHVYLDGKFAELNPKCAEYLQEQLKILMNSLPKTDCEYLGLMFLNKQCYYSKIKSIKFEIGFFKSLLSAINVQVGNEMSDELLSKLINDEYSYEGKRKELISSILKEFYSKFIGKKNAKKYVLEIIITSSNIRFLQNDKEIIDHWKQQLLNLLSSSDENNSDDISKYLIILALIKLLGTEIFSDKNKQLFAKIKEILYAYDPEKSDLPDVQYSVLPEGDEETNQFKLFLLSFAILSGRHKGLASFPVADRLFFSAFGVNHNFKFKLEEVIVECFFNICRISLSLENATTKSIAMEFLNDFSKNCRYFKQVMHKTFMMLAYSTFASQEKNSLSIFLTDLPKEKRVKVLKDEFHFIWSDTELQTAIKNNIPTLQDEINSIIQQEFQKL